MRQAVNILFLGGAKRVSMGRMFIEAGASLGLDVVLFSYELTTEVPVAEVATVIVGRRWADPELMAHLHEVVTDNRIDIVIPFVDPAVEVAARYCASDREVWTPNRNAALSSLMFDKVEADALFRAEGFPLPALPAQLSEEAPIIAKPRHGSASKGVRVLQRAEYEALAANDDAAASYLFQEYIGRRREYTVDCYVTSAGKFICAVPRVRLETAGGEVMSTITLRHPEIEAESRRILSQLGFTGPITIQFLAREEAPEHPMLMEINPRLGGGCVCSVHAGANIPAYILTDWLGREVEECTAWTPGLKICRYMQEVVFPPKN